LRGWSGVVLIRDSLDVLTPIPLELRLDPVNGVAIPLRALTTIAELSQSFDGVFVSLEVEAINKDLYRISRGIDPT
jgi:hypothetical protein